MGRTPVQRVLDEVIASALVPLLRAGGYRKEKRTFRRASPDCIQVVNVQASAWGTRTSQKFTVNLGVFFPKAQAVLEGYSPVRLSQAGPTESQCHVRQRLGMLMPEHDDVWWSIEAGRDSSRVSKAVGEAMTAFGVPWLEAMSNFDVARREVESWPVQALGFDVAAGDIQRARQRFRELLETRADPSAWRKWGRTRGLTE
jgi:hypothetical protein